MNELLPDEIVAIHRALEGAHVPHAFGGAIALAYWGTPRYTHDVDINIALPADQHGQVLDALATVFPIGDRERAAGEIMRIGQTRLRWDALPIDLFFADTPFHESMAARARRMTYVETEIDVITPEDLIVCKALFNRPKDWVDIENIVAVQRSLDEQYLRHWLLEFCEPEDPTIDRIDALLRGRPS